MPTAIEKTFPAAQTNRVAEQESWRKEVNRPTYHLHKWWAKRLGSVFRTILIGALSPEDADVARLFYEPVRFPGAVVLDPMMGAGTTVGEALKLGCRVIGQDINPVSYMQVRKAIEPCDPERLDAAYRRLEAEVAPRIRALYRVADPDDPSATADTLYAFWVKVLDCPSCRTPVRLFDTSIFARHAYPGKVPDVHSVCPTCGEVNRHHGEVVEVTCRDSRDGVHTYDPRPGVVTDRGAGAICPACGTAFKILDVIAAQGPARHQLYASLVRTTGGKKRYVRARPGDLAGADRAADLLGAERPTYPDEPILPGHNTDQLRSYGYRHWSELFTARQLYSLALLAGAIRDEPDAPARGLLALLLSGTAEFNNVLCTYKGEGTGAVRPAFSHHILKPERMPLENSVWGLPESSGCFSTLYPSRLRRALDYRRDPFELRVVSGKEGKPKGEKVYGLAAPLTVPLADTWEDLASGRGRALIRCGDARQLPLPDASVDVVVTDPPYFDFVHYSELADLFHGWLRLTLEDEYPGFAVAATRQPGEVQQRDPAAFAAALGGVLAECRRVLKPAGVLAFSFHHSRDEGWAAVGRAILDAGLGVVAAHPVKAEMSVATPKSAAGEAIDLDAVLVCRRRESPAPATLTEALSDIAAAAAERAATYREATSRPLSRGDLRVLLQSQTLVVASRHEGALRDLTGIPVTLDVLIRVAGGLLDGLVTQVRQRAAAD